MNDTVINLIDLAPTEESFREAVLAGLSRERKAIPCKFLYDARGSALFEQICELPEYYPTRTERRILSRRAGEIAALAGPLPQLVEFGSGSSVKTKILLEALQPSCYVPIDISRDQLEAAARGLMRQFDDLDIIPICADYTRDDFISALPWAGGARIGFFPGSTIGNFEPDEAEGFLDRCATLLGPGSGLVIGVDLRKDLAVLDAAYNDAQGITAEFNLNLLERMNRELDGDFVLSRFAHEAFYDEREGRIEIYIRSLERQRVRVAGRTFAFDAGERIHTEYSYKYDIETFQHLAGRAGFYPEAAWSDLQALFSVHFLRVA
jgi:dimethylhistidine N-methyltransferase